jgi:hypothetical protein
LFPASAADAHAKAAPTVSKGTVVSGLYTDTFLKEGTPVYEVFSETNDLTDALNVTWEVGPIVAGSNPKLYVDAKVGGASTEGFYFYYSRTLAGPYTFMFVLPSTQVTNATYTFQLPISVSGSIWVRVVDASPSSDSIHDSVYVNWIAVKGTSSISWFERTLNAADYVYTCIGIGNVDSMYLKDIVLGRNDGTNGLITVITLTSAGAKLSEYTPVTLSTLLPTQDSFEVTDVNGDGLVDIVSVAKGPPDNLPVIVYEWLNLGASLMPSFNQITVLDLVPLYGDSCGADDSGNPDAMIYCIAVGTMYG